MTTSIEKVEDAITEAVSQCNIEAIQNLPLMQQTFALANGMSRLRDALTEQVVREVFMPLQGSKLGFRTDRDDKQPKGYPWDVVRDCVIDAMVRGFRPIGNEMNIIAGNPYYTKEAYERKVGEFPGLTDLSAEPGIPHMSNGGALVPYHASWVLDGRTERLVCDIVDVDGKQVDRRIAVRVNSGAGVDNILGKAKRKFYARIYERLTGVRATDGDVTDTEGVELPTEPKTATAVKALTDRHRGKAQGKKGQQPITDSDGAERLPGED